MKKTRFVVIVAVLTLCCAIMPLSAMASEAADLLLAIQSEFIDAPAVSFVMDINVGMSLGEQELEFGMSNEVVITRDPVQMKMVMDMSSLGLESSETYIIAGDDGYVRYQKDSGVWTRTDLTPEEAAEYVNQEVSSTDMLLTFGENVDGAEMLPNEKINDIDCKVIRGTLSGADLAALTQSQSVGQTETLTDEQLAAIVEGMDGTDVFYYINAETGELVSMSIDMSQVYLSMITAMASDGAAEDDASSVMGMASISKMEMIINIVSIGEVEPIEVPAEALQ